MSESQQEPLFESGLPPKIKEHFDALCLSAEDLDLTKLEAHVKSHLGQIRTALEDNEFLDIKSAEQIAQTLTDLISEIEDYPQEGQKLIVGAAQYFILEEDHWPDTKNLLGFDDDIKVINFVLERIGIKVELKIGIYCCQK